MLESLRRLLKRKPLPERKAKPCQHLRTEIQFRAGGVVRKVCLDCGKVLPMDGPYIRKEKKDGC